MNCFLLFLGAVSDMQMQEHFDEFFEVTFMSHSAGWASNASQWMWYCCHGDNSHVTCSMHTQRQHTFSLKIKAYHNRKLTYSALPNQEVFSEMEEKYGEVEEMNICDNLGDHLVGNVYVKVSVALYSQTTVIQ